MVGTLWTADAIDYLSANYPNGDITEIANRVGRTEKAVTKYHIYNQISLA